MKRRFIVFPLLVLALTLLVTCVVAPKASLASDVFVAQNSAGGNTGADCANARDATFFNTAGNWGAGAGQIGNNTTVHICGTFSGGTNANLLVFQGSGAPGQPITVLFEPGAIVQASYCAANGCIDLNGRSHLVIDGGVPCGKLSGATGPDTACNGKIQNMLAGSTGQTCPGGPCTQNFGAATRSALIGNSGGNPTDVEIRNLQLGPVYIRDGTVTTDDGTETYAILVANGTFPQDIRAHHLICKSTMRCYLMSLGTATTTVSGYQLYNSSISDMCWAMGVGAAAPTMHMNTVIFHDNEVQNWDRWVRYPASCHPNGTMWFNGDGQTIYANGAICESGCLAYNNYIHGDMGAGYCCGSASGMLSCQDNCKGGYWFNNILVSTCTGQNPTRSCGGIIYFNGPGGGSQQVYNNTIIAAAGECTTHTGLTGNVIMVNNLFQGCTGVIEIRPNTPTVVTSDFNLGFNVQTSTWMIYNTAVGLSSVSLAAFHSTYGQSLHSSTGDPKLDASYHPQSGSAAIGLGTNLTSLGITALNTDASGNNPRPAVGAWDAGALQFAPGTALNPPTNLKVQ